MRLRGKWDVGPEDLTIGRWKKENGGAMSKNTPGFQLVKLLRKLGESLTGKWGADRRKNLGGEELNMHF